MNSKSLPKDVFLHLLGIIALYTSSVSFIALLFQYINIYFPDPLSPLYYSSVFGPIRWSMASLIIIFPVYILISWMLNRDYKSNPEKLELRIRKWLVYFTLFAAAVIIIGDLISLVYNFLGGDLTTRFLLKVLSIFLVAVIIFGYYLLDLRQKLTGRHLKILALIVSAIILAGIIFGFFTAGSPLKARKIEFDERRMNNLQTIQNEIINYWTQKDKLPETLSDLVNSITGFAPPADPETGEDYEYQILSRESSKPSFELCAEFDFSSEEILPSSKSAPLRLEDLFGYQQNWNHKKGRDCFERFIDPELYRKRVELKD